MADESALEDLRALLRKDGVPYLLRGSKVIVTSPLTIQHSDIRALPEFLEVHGRLYISDCPCLESLPRSLTICGSLSVINCPLVHSLPCALPRLNCLNLLGSLSITSLPKDLSIWGRLFLSGESFKVGADGVTAFNAAAAAYRAVPGVASSALLENEEGHWRHSLALAILRNAA